MKSICRCAFTVWLVLFSMPALGEQSGRELADRARDSMASVPALKRVDTSQVSNALIVGHERKEQEPQTTVTQIEIDMSKLLARMTATVQGKELVVLKQGERAAMKLGAGPWKIPSGPYESMIKGMGNIFQCEIETPETKESAPEIRASQKGADSSAKALSEVVLPEILTRGLRRYTGADAPRHGTRLLGQNRVRPRPVSRGSARG